MIIKKRKSKFIIKISWAWVNRERKVYMFFLSNNFFGAGGAAELL